MAFHEIAVEPTAIQTLRDIQLVLSLAGFGKGRLIANFPDRGPDKGERKDENWAWRVVQSVKRFEVGKASKVRELLIAERRKILPSKRKFEHSREWLYNARAEHGNSPFGAIITENPAPCDFECSLDGISLEKAPACLREDQHVHSLPKLPEEFARALMPMLRCAKELRFVDPFFMKRIDSGEIRLSAKHARVVQEIARQLNAISRIPQTLEFHLLERCDDPAKQLSDFAKSMEAHLPKSWKAEAFLWREIPGSRKFHARYVLTDLGGAGSDYGLDQGNSPGDETDLYLLTEPLRAKRVMDLSTAGTAFTLAAGPVVVAGIRG